MDQLDYVEKYLAPYAGKISSLDDLYMSILYPKAVGKPDNFVVFDSKQNNNMYPQNKGLDANKDGVVTKAEATARVRNMLNKGYSGTNAD